MTPSYREGEREKEKEKRKREREKRKNLRKKAEDREKYTQSSTAYLFSIFCIYLWKSNERDKIKLGKARENKMWGGKNLFDLSK